MTLQEEFETETGWNREKIIDPTGTTNENNIVGFDLDYFVAYSKWLEAKLHQGIKDPAQLKNELKGLTHAFLKGIITAAHDEIKKLKGNNNDGNLPSEI